MASDLGLVPNPAEGDPNELASHGTGDRLAEELVDRGLEMQRARQYAGAVMRGGIVVAAEAETADKALAVMNRFELEGHRCLTEGAPLVHCERPAIHDYERPRLLGRWETWVADRQASPP